MGKIKIYTDEDIDIAVSKALKLRGIDIFSTLECKRSSTTDDEQIEYAKSIGAILITHNVQDFPRIHYEYIKQG